MNRKSTRSLVLTLSLMVLGASSALGQVTIYDSTVNPLPGNLPSEGPEAYAFTQFGDGITFAAGPRHLKTVTVTLSSWGCQTGKWNSNDCVTAAGATFTVPVTFNIYDAGNPLPGAQIATLTQTFTVPYRPSADNANCTGANAGKWWNGTACFNGLANNITFDFSSANVTLPNSAVYGIVYNTSNYGPNPIGTSADCYTSSGGCPYDSLNIALAPVVVTGTKTFVNTLYQNTISAFNYCDGGLAGTETFRLDSPTSACWAGYIPAVKFTAVSTTTPSTKDACKNGGWQTLTDANGEPFKNQGQCVTYTNH